MAKKKVSVVTMPKGSMPARPAGRIVRVVTEVAKKGKKKQNRRSRGPSGMLSSGRSQNSFNVLSATADLSVKTYVKFREARMGLRDGLGVDFCVPWMRVGQTASGASSVGAGVLIPATGSSVQTFGLTSPDSGWYNALMVGLANQFSRFRYSQRMKLMYRPSAVTVGQSAASSGTAAYPIAFLWVDDPNHGLVSSPTLSGMAQALDYREFPAALPWDLPVANEDNELKYTQIESSPTQSDLRFSMAGALIALQNFSATGPVGLGWIYLCGSLELYDPVPTGAGPGVARPFFDLTAHAWNRRYTRGEILPRPAALVVPPPTGPPAEERKEAEQGHSENEWDQFN